MAIDDGYAVDYTAVTRGTPIYSSDEVEIGTVHEILDNSREKIFDGIVFDSVDGQRLFVDAPEVARTAERGVTLTITSAQIDQLSPPESHPVAGGGLLARLFGRR